MDTEQQQGGQQDGQRAGAQGGAQGQWQQGTVVELEITGLSDSGEGVGRYAQRVVFVPETVTGDRVRVRLTRVKPQFAQAQLLALLTASPHRQRPACIVADKCGGCQWQHVTDAHQQRAKLQIVADALQRIAGLGDAVNEAAVNEAAVNDSVEGGTAGVAVLGPMVAPSLAAGAPATLHYRNKVTYPLGRSQTGAVQAGYYRKGSHRLINLNQCPVQDRRLDPLLAEIKQDIQARGWSIYNEDKHQGLLRHLSLRIGRRTGEILLTLVATEDRVLELESQAQDWGDRYPNLVGVCININPQRGNAIFGPTTREVWGRPYLHEHFAGLTFAIRPETFFQVYTEQAEALLGVIERRLKLQGQETIVDAYCGVGTLSLPLANQVAQVVGLEIQAEAVAQARANANLNGITNARFEVGSVEEWLPQMAVLSPDVVLLDPPRKGCDRAVLDALMALKPKRIVYMSCKPSTLARDVRILIEAGGYHLDGVQPADFFPQTSHVEAVAFLERSGS